MNLAIIGSRSFNNYELLEKTLNDMKINKIISGGAKGADSLAELYAKKYNIPTLIFKPNWKKFGKIAGMLRNKDIVNNADVIVAFWNGYSKGTKNSIDYANKLNKQVIIIYI